jgi:outer membrane receptor protein involved in Fe transport
VTNTRNVTETAIFGEISYAFTDRWQVTIGGRQFDYDFSQAGTVLVPFVSADVGANSVAVADDGFLTKVNTSFDFTDRVMGYVTLSEGYRVGGANPAPPCELPLQPGQNPCALPDEILIDPDTTTNFEVGVHSSWNGGALIFNGAVYRIDWEDVQTLSTTVNGALPIAVNGGEARTQGIELAFQSQGGEHWTFSGTYAYNEAELTSFAAGLVDGEDAFAGDRLSGTPEQQGSFYASYRRALGNGWDLDLGYGFTFSSNVLTKVGLRNNGETLGGYTVHGLSAGLSQDRWSATLYADNVTDKFAETAVRQDPTKIRSVGGFDVRRYYRNVMRPRSVGIEFRYRVGG